MGVAGEEGALGHIKEGLGQRQGKKWELDFTQVGWRRLRKQLAGTQAVAVA